MRAAVPDVRSAASTSGRAPLWWVLGAFAVIALILTGVVTIGSHISGPSLPYLDGPSWLDGWSEGDSGWYYGIATYGYFYNPGQQSSIAFFPSYPLTVRGLGDLIGGDYQIAGSLLGVLFGAAAAVLFAQWVWRRLPRGGAVTAIAILLLYPYAFFLYGAMYSDSMFILTAIGSFMLLERRHYWLAGLVGALATAGRPVGVAVAVGLVVRMLEMRAEARSVSSPAVPSSRAPPIAFGPSADGPTANRPIVPNSVPHRPERGPGARRAAGLARAVQGHPRRSLARGRSAGVRARPGRVVHLPVGPVR